MVPEEKPAAVEVGPEFPKSVQEVEVPPSRYSVQVKTDRSQQTTCTETDNDELSSKEVVTGTADILQ